MSEHNIPEESSQFLLCELTDSNSTFEKETDESSAMSVNTSGSGEKIKKQEESDEEYEEAAINKILSIKSEVETIQQEIEEYTKEQLQEEFKRLEELLIQKTLTLDDINTRAIDSVRELRKHTIRFVQDCLKELDAKLN